MFCRRSREDLDSRIRRAEQAVQAVRLAWPRREPYFRRSRISQEPGASYSGKVCVVCVRGGAGKVPQIRGNLVHFPGEKQRKWRYINIFEGKVPQIRGNLVHFPTSVKKEDAGNRDYGKHQNDNNRFPFDRNPAAFHVVFQVMAEQGCVLSCIPG